MTYIENIKALGGSALLNNASFNFSPAQQNVLESIISDAYQLSILAGNVSIPGIPLNSLLNLTLEDYASLLFKYNPTCLRDLGLQNVPHRVQVGYSTPYTLPSSFRAGTNTAGCSNSTAPAFCQIITSDPTQRQATVAPLDLTGVAPVCPMSGTLGPMLYYITETSDALSVDPTKRQAQEGNRFTTLDPNGIIRTSAFRLFSLGARPGTRPDSNSHASDETGRKSCARSSRRGTSSSVTERKPLVELKTTYLQNDAVGTEAEYERLDSIHNAIRGIQNGALSWVSLENPKYILDMGCGSAAWAIQAAETFPEAEVLAVDIIPKPNRRFPDNLKYQQVNLCEPPPPQFKPKTFDAIHARLLFVHLPNYKEILQKTVEMLKPGGWLFITDIVTVPYGIRNPLPSNLRRYFKGRANMIASTGGTPYIGQELGVVLNSFPELIEVNVRKMAVPVSQWQDESLDPALRELAAIMRRSLVFGIKSAPQFGLSEEEVIHDLDNPDNNIYVDLYFTWSRRLQFKLQPEV
ncbi:hypothetical protein Clacol_009522 [Clathrus columnatus]|uniref:Methyltransferase domain-containing protein n=1 Tax=Clathrus columnatus TaxID=1419009 RepID=A0AAV5ASC6_9AGAM|nr:hypothetical protein Clacol_009522 [Clathrus columnatus]